LDENELLFQHNINFNDLHDWEKRGIGVYWKIITREVYNSLKDEKIMGECRQLFADLNLPIGNWLLVCYSIFFTLSILL
jgi:tRNA(His) guanylyltransferase